MAYRVECWHHAKVYRKGDLEDDLILEAEHTLPTRKEAKQLIENRLSRLKNVVENITKEFNLVYVLVGLERNGLMKTLVKSVLNITNTF